MPNVSTRHYSFQKPRTYLQTLSRINNIRRHDIAALKFQGDNPSLHGLRIRVSRKRLIHVQWFHFGEDRSARVGLLGRDGPVTMWKPGRERRVDRFVVYFCFGQDQDVWIFSFHVVFEALHTGVMSVRQNHNETRRTFFWLAARPQMFHEAIRTESDVLGGKVMVTGRTLFVG